jgi:tetratricopeptide (TPR) repeat protein
MHSHLASRRRRATVISLLVLVASACALLLVAAMVAYALWPGFQYRVLTTWAEVYTSLNPMPENLPTPAITGAQATPTSAPTATASVTAPAGVTPGASTSTVTITAAPSSTPAPPTATWTPLPPRAALQGVTFEYQLFNNCGPASLAMTLSYWGWQGTQKDVAAALKPEQDDKNVSPSEMYEYLLTQGFDAYIRMNGDLETIKRFIAAGYPVLIEKGYTCEAGERCTGWFGHYSVFTAYDDASQTFVTQDSFRGPNLALTYDYVLANWRAFNYLYLIVFPTDAERDARVRGLLGDALDEDRNYQDALARAQGEALSSVGQDAAFAWFNVGTSQQYLLDYASAAAAYDESRKIGLPYRMLWYQFGPYRAYYYMARYQEVIDLATFAIDSNVPPHLPGLEESYYWRGEARVSLGFRDAAIEDFRTALERNPGFQPAADALADLSVTP